MSLFLRVLSYLAPSKGKILLVVVLSLLTSLFSVVSIYSVLPLLNAIFTADKTVTAPAATDIVDVVPASTPSARLVDTEVLQQQITELFQQAFHASTKQQTLLNICLFLIAAFALKNLFLYLNKQIIFRVQTKATKALRDDVFHSIIEMHLDYFNKQRVGGLMNHVYHDVQSVQNSIATSFINFVQNPFTIFVYVGILFVLSWKLTLFAFGVSILIFSLSELLVRKFASYPTYSGCAWAI